MKRLAIAGAVVAILGLLVVPLVLHFGQKSHNHVMIDWQAVAPAGSPQGVAFGSGTALLIEAELDGTTGWRPNDVILWGPTLWADNNANRQLGILQALRETVRVFKDHLTKVSSDVYDRNLVAADNLLRNDPERWAFPSAESRYREAAEHLGKYVAGLRSDPQTSRPINARNMELLRLIQAWSDLLGDAHADLLRANLPWLQVDDIFYRVSGYCHVIAHMIPALRIEYTEQLTNRAVVSQLFQEVEDPLARCAQMKPVMVLNGGDTSVVANHRRNLDAYVNEARQKMYSIREELEK